VNAKANAFAETESVSQGRVLIVSDEPNIRRALRITLVAGGYDTADAATSEEALRLTGSTEYDVVLLDSDNADHLGIGICRQIRETSGAVIIVMSGGGQDEASLQALRAGAHNCISKPFSVSQITDYLRVRYGSGDVHDRPTG